MSDLLHTVKTNGKEYRLAHGILYRLNLETSHFYFLNDEYLPSVTSILDEAAPVSFGLREFWKNNTREESDAILEKTRGIGSRVHNAIEALLLGKEIDLSAFDYLGEVVKFNDREKKCIVAFVDWFRTFKPESYEAEQVVASGKYKYAGTLDFVGKVNGERWLVDFKTSSAIHFNYEMQVAAYKQAYEESYPDVKIDRCFILRIGTTHKGTPPKNGKLQETGPCWEFKEANPNALKTFHSVYNTYLDLHGGKVTAPENIIVYPNKLKLFV